MAENIEKLRLALEAANIEEQKEILERFMLENTDDNVLEGIRIANESLSSENLSYIINSHVKE